MTFPVPSIVDDASYAVECAAVGEVDLVRLDAQIRELELRIAVAGGSVLATRPADAAGVWTGVAASIGRDDRHRAGGARAHLRPTWSRRSRLQRVERVTVIKPAPRRPHLDVPELWHYRELLGRFVWRDIKVRYKQTFLGVAWALLVPIFSAVVYTVVFGKFANFPAGDVPYPALVLSGLLVMQYFTSSLTGSSVSLVANMPLVTKVYFPRVLLPLASAIVPAVDFAARAARARPAHGVLRHRAGRVGGRARAGVPRARLRDCARAPDSCSRR